MYGCFPDYWFKSIPVTQLKSSVGWGIKYSLLAPFTKRSSKRYCSGRWIFQNISLSCSFLYWLLTQLLLLNLQWIVRNNLKTKKKMKETCGGLYFYHFSARNELHHRQIQQFCYILWVTSIFNWLLPIVCTTDFLRQWSADNLA